MNNLINLIFIVILLCGSCLPADEKPGDIVRPDNPELVKLPFAWPNGDEATMVTFENRPLILSSYRQIGGGEMYLKVQDLFTGDQRTGGAAGWQCLPAARMNVWRHTFRKIVPWFKI